MNRFGRRLERDLSEIAQHAAPSGSGWDRIHARLHQNVDDPEVEVIMLEINDTPTNTKQRRTALVAAAAAVGLILIIAATSLVRLGDDEVLAAGTEAEQVVARYIESFNAGDVEGAIGLFAPDAVITDGDANRPENTGSPTVEQYELLLSWYAPQDAEISEATCATTETTPGQAQVQCQWLLIDAVTKAADGPGDLVDTEWTIADGTVVAFDRRIDWSAAEHSLFMAWVVSNHPEDQTAVTVFPYEMSVAEAREAGQLIASWAPEWGQQLND